MSSTVAKVDGLNTHVNAENSLSEVPGLRPIAPIVPGQRMSKQRPRRCCNLQNKTRVERREVQRERREGTKKEPVDIKLCKKYHNGPVDRQLGSTTQARNQTLGRDSRITSREETSSSRKMLLFYFSRGIPSVCTFVTINQWITPASTKDRNHGIESSSR
jgi:hypothetical protein